MESNKTAVKPKKISKKKLYISPNELLENYAFLCRLVSKGKMSSSRALSASTNEELMLLIKMISAVVFMKIEAPADLLSRLRGSTHYKRMRKSLPSLSFVKNLLKESPPNTELLRNIVKDYKNYIAPIVALFIRRNA